jgi:hypothetical protein
MRTPSDERRSFTRCKRGRRATPARDHDWWPVPDPVLCSRRGWEQSSTRPSIPATTPALLRPVPVSAHRSPGPSGGRPHPRRHHHAQEPVPSLLAWGYEGNRVYLATEPPDGATTLRQIVRFSGERPRTRWLAFAHAHVLLGHAANGIEAAYPQVCHGGVHPGRHSAWAIPDGSGSPTSASRAPCPPSPMRSCARRRHHQPLPCARGGRWRRALSRRRCLLADRGSLRARHRARADRAALARQPGQQRLAQRHRQDHRPRLGILARNPLRPARRSSSRRLEPSFRTRRRPRKDPALATRASDPWASRSAFPMPSAFPRSTSAG